jgi:hypothetical protein
MVKIKIPCSFCGTVIERKESQIARSKSGNVFCNNGCRIAHEKKFGNCNKGKHIQRGWKRTEALKASA